MKLKTIIDVSEWNGDINWEELKPHIDGAIIRCGYGDNINYQDDKTFKRNADECTRLGIPFGVYLYSYATTEEQAMSEAKHALRLVKGYNLDYPIYIDLEERDCKDYAIMVATIFGDIIEKAGYWCGVYANKYWWENYLVGLERFTKWVAEWVLNGPTYKGKNLDMWQYTSAATVPGVKGCVDMNICYREFNELKKSEEDKTEQMVNEIKAIFTKYGY